MKNKKRIHCTYIHAFQSMENENSVSSEKCVCILCRCVYICFVYVSHEGLSAADPYRAAMVNDLLLSSPFPLTRFYFYLFFVSSFSRSRTPPSSPGYRGFFFFFLVNIDRRRRHGFRLRVYTHQATSTLPEAQRSRRERSALPHETTPGGPFEWPLRDGLSS